MNQRTNIWKAVDWGTAAIFIGLAVFGWLNIYGAVYDFDQSSIFSFDNKAGKQLVWLFGSLLLGGALILIDERTYEILGYWLYGATILLLLATPFLAHDVKGSLSWIPVGPVSLQPAEFAKCMTAIAIAKYMGRYGYQYRTWHDLIVPFAMIIVPMFIIAVLQKETGSALVFAAFLIPFFRQGMSGRIFIYGIAAIVVGILAVRLHIVPESLLDKVFEPHQKIRILYLLGMVDDPLGIGYNVTQSRIAIGSGGLFGKGYLNGTQTKLNFVPEQDTDFIFCTVGEEWGFLGSVAVLALYLYFIIRLIHIAERQRDTFGRVYGYSVVGIFLFHLTVNIGMILGLLPVIGIPLPMFSYGGSSLWGFTLLLFILLRIDAARMNKLH